MADKFRLLFDNNAKSKKQIADELKRIIDLKDKKPAKKSPDSDPLGELKDAVSSAVKKAVQNKISSIVQEALQSAAEELSADSHGEKIPPRPARDNISYVRQNATLQPDELAFSPSMYEEDDDGSAVRMKIEEMRQLGQVFYNGYMLRQCAEETLVKQGEFMKDITDCFERSCFCGIERPIYGAMSTDQLRTYFTWRTQARQGNYPRADKPYILLYCFELLNKIGVMSPTDAYTRLYGVWQGCRDFCPALDKLLPRWLKDFRAYNKVEDSLIPEDAPAEAAGADDSDILHRVYSRKLDCLMERSSYNLKGSIFFTDEHRPMLEGALEAALNALDNYFSDKNITLFELVCGRLQKSRSWSPFAGAYVDLDRMDGFHSLKISPMEQYSTKRGQPCLEVFEPAPYRNFVGWVLKSVESVLRRRTGFRYSITPNITPVLEDFTNRERLYKPASAPEFTGIIPTAVELWCDEHGIFPPKKQKKQKPSYNFDEVPDSTAPTTAAPVEIDVSKLAKIREESDDITSRLIIEEADTLAAEEITDKITEIEADDFGEQTDSFAESYSQYNTDSNITSADFSALPPEWAELAAALTAEDIELLQALLNGTADALCRSRGVMPETEYDRINSASMEAVGDVLIENSEVIEDYLPDVQQMISCVKGQ
ncbi:MAG: TerB N-terminal domain-containing protein [Oscillospiraceae bacterium]